MGLAVAVEHLVDGLTVILGKHHGQVEDGHLGDKGDHGSDLAAHQINIARLHLGQQIHIVAQLAVKIQIDRHLAAGDLLHFLCKQAVKNLSSRSHRSRVRQSQLHRLQIRIGPGSRTGRDRTRCAATAGSSRGIGSGSGAASTA